MSQKGAIEEDKNWREGEKDTEKRWNRDERSEGEWEDRRGDRDVI